MSSYGRKVQALCAAVEDDRSHSANRLLAEPA